ncbi:MAG TPA: TonB-dependent receptor, partial [Vicinamibacteria bacterium]|nr:TonB-dependent receptor [Vicinamibacteria bacterium]
GSIDGRVLDPSGAAVRGAKAFVDDGSRERTVESDESGRFRFGSLPYGLHRLRVAAAGFETHEEVVEIRSNLTSEMSIALALSGTRESLTVRAADRTEVSAITRIGDAEADRLPGASVGGSVQPLVAAAAGWSTEDNGLLHNRGVDDGFLYVVGGIPWFDRIDTFFAAATDVEAFQSLEILDGHLPAEYGNASGGVINVVPRSGLSRDWAASAAVALGSLESWGGSAATGGRISSRAGLFVAASYRGSEERFLDPVDPDNFNNAGNVLRFTSRLDFRPSPNDLLVFDLTAGRSGFRVTNTLEQELAGQRQRQELRDDHQSLIWQRSGSPRAVMDAALYRHSFGAELLPSAEDTPVSASQDRRHTREGALLSLTRLVNRHLLKGGADVQRVSARESFSFYTTDEGADVSDEAEAFGPDDPFRFDEDVVRHQGSLYFQDAVSFAERVTVDAGVRFDWTTLLESESAISPRLGVALHAPALRTTFRGSYNRLFKPPQVENLLLSSSEEARELSPFEGGGASVPAERQHAFEAGFSSVLGSVATLDAIYWHREVRNYADPNVFFGTNILFPNSVASGRASGVTASLTFPLRRGFSGFVRYGNSRVVQFGPINGGLFLEEEVIEIGPGTAFVPDHDQRNVVSFGAAFDHHGTGFWASFYGRYESGTPLEVEEEELDEVMERRGASLVDFDRMRVKPRTVLDAAVGKRFFRGRRAALEVQLEVRNLADASFAYNFSNPFSGTHFGPPRLFYLRAKLAFPG